MQAAGAVLLKVVLSAVFRGQNFRTGTSQRSAVSKAGLAELRSQEMVRFLRGGT